MERATSSSTGYELSFIFHSFTASGRIACPFSGLTPRSILLYNQLHTIFQGGIMNSSTAVKRPMNGGGPRPSHTFRPTRQVLAEPAPARVETEHAETEVPDLAAESRIEALRLLVLAFLREVDSLRRTIASRPKKRRELMNLDKELDAFETSLICEALIRTNGNQRDAARMLKIKPTTLNAKMKRLGIEIQTTLTSVGG